MNANGAKQGVNLGGWFIPEKWMTPELFDGLEAGDTAQLLMSNDGRERYITHVQDFITESDLNLLASNNVKLLRIPVAWWMLADEYDDLATICIEKLDWLFQQAELQEFKVLIDYHGARGSQNGKDHSGDTSSVNWKKYQQQNVVYLHTIAKRYATSPSLWGVELLNEPAVKRNYWTLYRFYKTAKKQLKTILPSSVRIIIHDGFIPLLFTNIAPWRASTVLDMHLYEIPVKQGETIQAYFDRRDTVYTRRIRFYTRFQPVIIGEWSGVVPERFLKDVSNDKKAELIRENIARQLELYKAADAWMFWSLKTKDEMMWNFISLLEHEQKLL